MAKFKPGESGNPDGRPKGSKNKITLLKESMELVLREEASPDDLKSVMREALNLALQGDRSMIKLILELHMSKGTSKDENRATEKVEINVNGLQPMEIKKETTVPLDEAVLLLASQASPDK